MKVGDLVRYPHIPEQLGIIIKVADLRDRGVFLLVMWTNTRDVRGTIFFVHPDWIELVESCD